MADFPEYPDAGEPCVNNTDEVLIARCVNGLRVRMWVATTEISGGGVAATAGGCGDCEKTKQDLIALAKEMKWKPKELIEALAAVKG